MEKPDLRKDQPTKLQTCCATTDSTSNSIRLNSSKHAHAPADARPLKNCRANHTNMYCKLSSPRNDTSSHEGEPHLFYRTGTFLKRYSHTDVNGSLSFCHNSATCLPAPPITVNSMIKHQDSNGCRARQSSQIHVEIRAASTYTHPQYIHQANQPTKIRNKGT